jgi:hypothetical protein
VQEVILIPEFYYEVEPRPSELGGGWKLSLYENGEEVGGGVFPDSEYSDAIDEGGKWLSSRVNSGVVKF